MLFHTTATLYSYTRNENNISSYWNGTPIKCNVQPLNSADITALWLEGGAMFDTYRIYTKASCNPWDKISVFGETYVVDSVGKWRGLQDSFNKVIAKKSNGI